MCENTELLNLRREDFGFITQEVLARGRVLRFRAKGGSMSPFIRNGDVVQVLPVKERINFGDVVFYRSSCGDPVVHRVIQTNKESIITKGDSVLCSDRPVLSKHVLGQVVSVEKNGWRIRLDRPMGKLLNILFATISPFSFLIYPPLKFMKRAGFLLL